MFGRRWKLSGLLLLSLLLAACCQCPELPVAELSLDKGQALRGETVTATVEGLDTAGAEVRVAGLDTEILNIQGNAIQFAVPETPAGVQPVVVISDAIAEGQLEVFGEDVIADRVTVLLQDSTPEAEADLEALLPEGFSLININPNGGDERQARPLADKINEGPCGGQLALIDVGGTPLGEAIEELKRLEEENEGFILEVDPASEGGPGFVDHLGAVGTRFAQARGRGGEGTLIAILDTGVNEHPELEERIRFDLGLNLLDPGSPPTDRFSENGNPTEDDAPNPEGHGTAVAVLAAGETLGVAPQAEIMPVKVCGDEQNSCLSSNVIIGTCHALSKAKEEDKLGRLVLNYSLGSDTTIDAVEAIIDYALGENVLVAAAGGNDRQGGLLDSPQEGSSFSNPPNYPAAYDLPGLVAVAALTLPCVDFDDLQVGAQYDLDSADFPSRFISNGVEVALEPLFSDENNASVTVGNDRLAGGEASELAFNGVRVTFDFGSYPLDGLSLRYGDYGRDVEFIINEQRITIDGVSGFGEKYSTDALTITTTPDLENNEPTPSGVMTLRGSVENFSVGGEPGFYVDDVCPLSSQAWTFADFSTSGKYIDISAPGENVLSGTPGNELATYRGTSFATPLVAGALALWREANPTMSPQDIEEALKATARSLEGLEPEDVGAGLLNLRNQP